jgi:uncharacterized protein YqeY
MTLKILQSEMIAALKAGDKERKDSISALVAAIKKAGIDKGCRDDIPETLVDEVVLKEKKTIQEMIDTCPADRVDTKTAYEKRLAVIDEFAPKLVSDAGDIEDMIYDICRDAGIAVDKANRPAIMKTVMPQLKGKVDMKIANGVISTLLS